MFYFRLLLVPLCIAAVGVLASANAAELAVSGTADGETRWFEMFSDAFVQLGRGEPQLENPSNSVHRFYPVLGGFPSSQELLDFDPTTFEPTNWNSLGSQVEAFTHDENFVLGGVTYDAGPLTGMGVETAAITGYQVDMAPNIGNSFAVNNRVYLTTINEVSGALTFDGGDLVGIDLTAEIMFSLDYRDFGADVLTFTGEFSIADGQFKLYVDQAYPVPAMAPMRYIWDSTGVIDETWSDATGDGVIDGADFLAWQRGLGKTGAGVTILDGDFNADGVVDDADLKIWQHQYGIAREPATLPPVAAVPEAASFMLSLPAILAASVLRRRR